MEQLTELFQLLKLCHSINLHDLKGWVSHVLNAMYFSYWNQIHLEQDLRLELGLGHLEAYQLVGNLSKLEELPNYLSLDG